MSSQVAITSRSSVSNNQSVHLSDKLRPSMQWLCSVQSAGDCRQRNVELNEWHARDVRVQDDVWLLPWTQVPGHVERKDDRVYIGQRLERNAYRLHW